MVDERLVKIMEDVESVFSKHKANAEEIFDTFINISMLTIILFGKDKQFYLDTIKGAMGKGLRNWETIKKRSSEQK